MQLIVGYEMLSWVMRCSLPQIDWFWLCSGNLDSCEIDEPTQYASYAGLPA